MRNPKILFIDDELKALALFKVNIEPYGFDVITASDGETGVVKAVTDQPDVIVLDIRLPKMNGWEACSLLKSLPGTKDIPVVFLTAYSSIKDKEKAKTLGAADYLTKPIDPDQIVEVLRGVIREKDKG